MNLKQAAACETTMKELFAYIFFFIQVVSALAQTQQGYIRTLGRQNKKGEPLANVSIRLKGGHNAVLSDNNGKFALVMHGKEVGESYILQQVRKSGYQLNDAGVIGRRFAFSDKIPHTIVMVSTEQLQKEKQRIETNAYKVAERNYEEKLAKLEQQVNDNNITKEKYRDELQSLQSSFEKYQLLIDGLADHYAHTDYDNLDEREREINICIENGELERADSLIHTLFDPVDMLKRNKEAMAHVEQQISQAKEMIAAAKIEMEKVVRQQKKEGEYLYNLYSIALARFDNEKAKYYIETRAELDSTNADWQFDAALYAHKQNQFKQASFYYTRALNANRELAEENPQAYEPGIAAILNNLASLYVDTQHHDKGEAAYIETLEIYRRLAEEDPEKYEPDVALILNNLGLLYINMKKYNEAEVMCNEALMIRRKLARENLAFYEPYVATTLSNIALLCSNTGRDIESERAYKEALEIYRRYAEENPLQYEPYVALTLNSLAILYHNTMRFDESEQMCIETQNIRNRSRNSVSTAHDPNVATMLNNLANFYYSTGRYEESEAMYNEALEIYEYLAKENIQVYEPYVAMVLNNLAGVYSSTKRFGDSENTYKKVLEMRRKLSLDDPQAYQPDLARTINNLASLYFDTKRYEESTALYSEALEIRRALAAENPQAYNIDVAMTLNNLAMLYHRIKQAAESEKCSKEALEIYSRLAKENPQLYESGLAFTLNNIASIYYHSGKFADAEKHFKEAITVYRQLAANDAKTYEPDLVRSLGNLASLYSDTRRFEESETVYNEVLAIRKRQAAENPAIYTQNLALTHYNMALMFVRNQQHKKSLEAFNEAYELFKGLAKEEPFFQQHYTTTLNWLVQLYKNEGEYAKGYGIYEEYMPIIRENYLKNPKQYRADYIKALGHHTSQCLIMNEYAKAEAYAREEEQVNPENMQIYRNLAIALVLQEKYADAEKIYFKYRRQLKDKFLEDLKTYKKQKKITKQHNKGLKRIKLILDD